MASARRAKAAAAAAAAHTCPVCARGAGLVTVARDASRKRPAYRYCQWVARGDCDGLSEVDAALLAVLDRVHLYVLHACAGRSFVVRLAPGVAEPLHPDIVKQLLVEKLAALPPDGDGQVTLTAAGRTRRDTLTKAAETPRARRARRSA